MQKFNQVAPLPGHRMPTLNLQRSNNHLSKLHKDTPTGDTESTKSNSYMPRAAGLTRYWHEEYEGEACCTR